MYTKRILLAVLKVCKGKSIREIAAKYDVPEERINEVIKRLIVEGLINLNEGRIEPVQKLHLIFLALKYGASVKEVARVLDWLDFEEITSYIFKEHNYEVKIHYRLTGKKEIDVLAYKGKVYFAVDCKHWSKPLHPSSVKKIVSKQIERIETLLRELPPNVEVYPLIVTLYPSRDVVLFGVPVIAIDYLNDFLLNFEGLKEDLLAIKGKFT